MKRPRGVARRALAHVYRAGWLLTRRACTRHPTLPDAFVGPRIDEPTCSACRATILLEDVERLLADAVLSEEGGELLRVLRGGQRRRA